jgi:rubrerythrin
MLNESILVWRARCKVCSASIVPHPLHFEFSGIRAWQCTPLFLHYHRSHIIFSQTDKQSFRHSAIIAIHSHFKAIHFFLTQRFIRDPLTPHFRSSSLSAEISVSAPYRKYWLLLLSSTQRLQVSAMDPGPIRDDMWVCGRCDGANLVATAPSQCPVCGHPRDYQIGCCKNPGEYLMDNDSSAEHQHSNYVDAHDTCPSNDNHHLHNTVDGQDFDDIWTCGSCGADNLDWCEEQCPVCGAMRANTSGCIPSSDYTSHGGAGSPAAGVWTCSSCSSPNADFHWPQCGACGHMN